MMTTSIEIMPYRFIAFSQEDAFRFAHASLKLMIEKLDEDGDNEEKVDFIKEQVLVILQSLAHVHGGFANLMVPAVVTALKRKTKTAPEAAEASSSAPPSSSATRPPPRAVRSKPVAANKPALLDEFLATQIEDTKDDTHVMRLSDAYHKMTEWWSNKVPGTKNPNSRELKDAMDSKLRQKNNEGWTGYKVREDAVINLRTLTIER